MRFTAPLVCIVSAIAGAAAAADPLENRADAAPSMFGSKAGQSRNDNGLKLKMIWCPPGSLKSDDADDTQPRVTLTHGYWLSATEVMRGQWSQIMETKPWESEKFAKSSDRMPATHVGWHDVMKFCAKLTEQERRAGHLSDDWHYTLPTEAQWEYACRANTITLFHFGDAASQLDDYGWYAHTGTARTALNEPLIGDPHPVGGKKPNAWGLFDMHGNVWEWCRDTYSERQASGRDPENKSDDPIRVIRGGSTWSGALDCRADRRDQQPADHGNFTIGFRVALCPVKR